MLYDFLKCQNTTDLLKLRDFYNIEIEKNVCLFHKYVQVIDTIDIILKEKEAK